MEVVRERKKGGKKEDKKEGKKRTDCKRNKRGSFKLSQHFCCALLASHDLSPCLSICNERKRRMEVVRERKKGGKKEEKKEGKKRTDC